MTKKRIGLIGFIFVVFVACFFYLNQKYDRFYRISGIDNEKRQLILNNLSEDEQDYLVEHSIATSRFMHYIEIPEFSLPYLSYYEYMEKTDKVFLNDTHLIKYTNELVLKIKSQTTKNISAHFKLLLKSDLDEVFMQSETYDLQLTEFYKVYFETFDTAKIGDIDTLNALNAQMEQLEFTDHYKNVFLKRWQVDYTLSDLEKFLIEKEKSPWIELVEHPDSLTAIVDEQNVISSYVPTPLTIPYDVSRVSFGMYLRQDAAYALEEMYQAIKKEVSQETFLLIGAYTSYEEYQKQFELTGAGSKGGDNEFQLGLSIDVGVLGVDYHLFHQTEICQFLKENAWKYGFILRYDNDDHIYRYVGKPAAKLMYEQQMTLEEYEGVKHE